MTDQPSTPTTTTIPPNALQRIEAAINSGDVPKIYFNGFVNALTSGDVMAVVERTGKAVAILNMSFTVAKSFAQGLGATVAQIESASGRQMLTTKEIEAISSKDRK
jgi:hypothetical protein